MSAAHELARREASRSSSTSSARSRAARPAAWTRSPAPAGAARSPASTGSASSRASTSHLPDTMSRIPYAAQRPRGVRQPRHLDADPDRARGRTQRARRAGALPEQPERLGGRRCASRSTFATHLGHPARRPGALRRAAQRPAVGLRGAHASASTRTRAGGSSPTPSTARPAYQKFLADGLTRSLVAARAREMSARTGGYILLQLLQDLATPGGQRRPRAQRADERRLDRPVAGRARAARASSYRFGCRVDAIASRERARDRRLRAARRRGGAPAAGVRATSADYYIAAVPVEVLRERIAMDDAQARQPGARRPRRAPGALDERDHVLPARATCRSSTATAIYIDSRVGADVDLAAAVLAAVRPARAWATATSAGSSRSTSPTGRRPGVFAAQGKIARQCSKDEIAAEVWDQLKAALNNGTEVLADANRAAWFLDPDIVAPNPTDATNLEPLLVNTAGSWAAPAARRAARGREPVPRLRLRADLHRPRDDGGRQRGGAPRRQRDPRRERLRRRAAATCGSCASPAACRSRSRARSTACSTGRWARSTARRRPSS